MFPASAVLCSLVRTTQAICCPYSPVHALSTLLAGGVHVGRRHVCMRCWLVNSASGVNFAFCIRSVAFWRLWSLVLVRCMSSCVHGHLALLYRPYSWLTVAYWLSEAKDHSCSSEVTGTAVCAPWIPRTQPHISHRGCCTAAMAAKIGLEALQTERQHAPSWIECTPAVDGDHQQLSLHFLA